MCGLKFPFSCEVLVFLLFFPDLDLNGQEKKFPYQLSKNDCVLLPLSTVIYFGGEIISDKTNFYLETDEIKNLDRKSVNAFDRGATYNWNRKLNSTSDVLSASIPLLPAFIVMPQAYKGQFREIVAFGAMYLEVYFLTKGITSLAKSFTGRTRPYLYNSSFTPGERYGFQGIEAPEANSSFFSGHTSASFAGAVFLSKTYTDIYGKSVWSKIIWASSLTAAGFTGYCRVAAGEHFASDVIVGAIVGSSIGYLIPALHKNKAKKLTYMFNNKSYMFLYRF